MPQIVILPAPSCRRSRKLLEYLESRGIPFTRIDLDSAEGRALAEEHGFRASPGILVNGVSVNPYDLLIPAQCRVDEEKARDIRRRGHIDRRACKHDTYTRLDDSEVVVANPCWAPAPRRGVGAQLSGGAGTVSQFSFAFRFTSVRLTDRRLAV